MFYNTHNYEKEFLIFKYRFFFKNYNLNLDLKAQHYVKKKNCLFIF